MKKSLSGVALGVGIVVGFVGRGETPAEAQETAIAVRKWEYQVFQSVQGGLLKKEPNDQGESGWELVHFDETRIILKRPTR